MSRVHVVFLLCLQIQLLPVFNLFRGKKNNAGDAIDYNQRSRMDIGDLIMETLEVKRELEQKMPVRKSLQCTPRF